MKPQFSMKKQTIMSFLYLSQFLQFPTCCYKYISHIVIMQMNWSFNFAPLALVPSQTPTFYFVGLPISSPKLGTQQKPAEKQEEPVREGIQVNLTASQLLAAGYQNNKKAWTEEEDKILITLFEENDLSWKEIASRIPGRTSKMCYSRYRRIESRSKQQWSRHQDAKLRNLVQVQGMDWEKISEYFPKRTQKQVTDHYMNSLRPEINKEPWTLDQDLQLIELLRQFGKDWVEIERRLIGRTQNQIKNRYFGRLKRLEDKKNETDSARDYQDKI